MWPLEISATPPWGQHYHHGVSVIDTPKERIRSDHLTELRLRRGQNWGRNSWNYNIMELYCSQTNWADQNPSNFWDYNKVSIQAMAGDLIRAMAAMAAMARCKPMMENRDSPSDSGANKHC